MKLLLRRTLVRFVVLLSMVQPFLLYATFLQKRYQYQPTITKAPSGLSVGRKEPNKSKPLPRSGYLYQSMGSP